MAQKEITIEYARQKLGEKSKQMTDKQIIDLLTLLRQLCNRTIDRVIKVHYD